MEYAINDTPDNFFRITVSGKVTKDELMPAMSEIITHPDYARKHTLWDYSSANLGLNMDDIHELSGILKLLKPGTEDFADRSVIVVKGEMVRQQVEMFVSMAGSGPLTFRVFTDLSAAEAYLNGL